MRTVLRAVVALTAAFSAPLGAQEGPRRNPHGALPPGLDCGACHTADAWLPLRDPLVFDHQRVSGFPLTGRHAAAACTRCHLDGRFDEPRVPADQCGSCHADVHQARLPGNCSRCHATTSFRDVPSVALHARTGFPLSGSHLQAPCESCHRNDRSGAFAGVPAACVACHGAAYAASASPDHRAAGFSTDCQQCHGTLTWTGGVAFDHARVARGFLLVEAHALLRCAACHMPPGLALRFTPSSPDDCLACHQAQYQQAHGQAGFPTTCRDCHSQTRWGGASFDHAPFFPLSGPHRASCATCHTVRGDFTTFSCLGCHAQGATDREHREVSGYTYDSRACYRCHARGKGEGS